MRKKAILKETTPQKVLIIAHNHPDLFPGGGELLAYHLFSELKKQAHIEALFVGATGKMNREMHAGTAFLSHEGREDEYLFFGDFFDYFNQSQKELAFLYRDFAKFLLVHQPDVIHFHHTIRIGVEALRIARDTLPKARILFTLHDFIPMCYRDGQMIRTQTNALCESATPARCHECFPAISSAKFATRASFIKSHLQLVDAFISPSQLLIDRYAAWGIPASKLHLVRNGTPRTPIAPVRPVSSANKSRNQFAFFGQISHFKGTLLLVEAAKILLEKGITNFNIRIHGNIDLQPEAYKTQFHAAVAQCSSNVSFHGRYVPHDLPMLMAQADWVVVPSIWWENAPLVIAEAQYHRRPVICSHIGGMAEHVRHGTNGLHFHTSDAHALAAVMQQAIQDDSLWKRLRNQTITPPSMLECMQQHLTLYDVCTLKKLA